MDRFRVLLLVILIAGLVGTAFIARPAPIQAPVINTPLPPTATPAATVVQDNPDSSQPMPPILAAATTAGPSSALPPQPSDRPTPTPEAFFASDVQTPVVGSSSSQGNPALDGWNPPPQEVPIAHHPDDHYWLIRPVGSDHNNFGLAHYPYGSNGPGDDLRVHHGIDLANPIGVEVYAAGDGTVIWSGKGHFNEYEQITAYGNTIVIEHDFGYKNKAVYTLYAHLSALLVRDGERVQAGQTIGLIGNTGQVTGPHVHFEVRVGRNWYFSTRNPDLWMAPYVGTGVIAGRVAMEDDDLVEDAPVTLIDLSTGQVVARTGTYAGFGVNADDYWGENFALPDVPAGRYLVTARYGAITWSAEVQVLPGITTWADMVISATAPPDEDSFGEPGG